MSFKKMEDFVSDMVTNEAKKVLVCSSGDGTITSFNISSKKMLIQVLIERTIFKKIKINEVNNNKIFLCY